MKGGRGPRLPCPHPRVLEASLPGILSQSMSLLPPPVGLASLMPVTMFWVRF